MSLVANAIDALFNGVSQQPANMRLPSQCEALVNGYPTVADGLRKRPPAELVAKLTATVFSSPHIHLINRDEDNRYSLILTDGDLEVYDLTTGASYTVTRPNIETWQASTAYAYNDGTFGR